MAQGPKFDQLLQNVLPAGSQNRVWALGEDHRYSRYKQTLITSMPTLTGPHNTGAVLEEAPPYLMLFLWAYQDKRISAQDVEDAFVAYSSNTFEALNSSDLMIAAQKNNASVGLFDSRVLLSEHLQTHRTAIANVAAKWPINYKDAVNQERVGWLLTRTQELYNTYPTYKERLDRIEGFIRTMREQGALSDVTSAHLATALMRPEKNTLTISGAWHLEGINYHSPQLEGVFAHTLRQQGQKDGTLHVSTALMGESLMFRAFNHIELYDRNANCKSAGSYDHFYITDKDEIISFAPQNGHAIGANSFGYTEDAFSCTKSLDVSRVYTHYELQPWRTNPEIAEAISWLRAAQFYDISFVKGSTPTEKRANTIDSLDRLTQKMGKEGDGLFNPTITPALFARFLQEAQASGSVTPHEINSRYLDMNSPKALPESLREQVTQSVQKGRVELARQLLRSAELYLDGNPDNDTAQLYRDSTLLRKHSCDPVTAPTKSLRSTGNKGAPQPSLFVSQRDAIAFAQAVTSMKDKLIDHDISGDDAHELLTAYHQYIQKPPQQPDTTAPSILPDRPQNSLDQLRAQLRNIADNLPKR